MVTARLGRATSDIGVRGVKTATAYAAAGRAASTTTYTCDAAGRLVKAVIPGHTLTCRISQRCR